MASDSTGGTLTQTDAMMAVARQISSTPYTLVRRSQWEAQATEIAALKAEVERLKAELASRPQWAGGQSPATCGPSGMRAGRKPLGGDDDRARHRIAARQEALEEAAACAENFDHEDPDAISDQIATAIRNLKGGDG